MSKCETCKFPNKFHSCTECPIDKERILGELIHNMQYQGMVPWEPIDVPSIKKAIFITNDLDNTKCPCGSKLKFGECCALEKTTSYRWCESGEDKIHNSWILDCSEFCD